MASSEELRKLSDAGLIDSRVRHTNQTIPMTHATMPLERVYCVLCGRPYGWVSTESYSFIRVNNIVVLCDACEMAMNGAPPLQKAPVQLVVPE